MAETGKEGPDSFVFLHSVRNLGEKVRAKRVFFLVYVILAEYNRVVT